MRSLNTLKISQYTDRLVPTTPEIRLETLTFVPVSHGLLLLLISFTPMEYVYGRPLRTNELVDNAMSPRGVYVRAVGVQSVKSPTRSPKLQSYTWRTLGPQSSGVMKPRLTMRLCVRSKSRRISLIGTFWRSVMIAPVLGSSRYDGEALKGVLLFPVATLN